MTIEATDAIAAEAGADPATFTITLTSGPLAAPLTVGYTVNPYGFDTATAGVDYVAPSGTVTIPAGATSASFTITPIDDAIGERDETLSIILSDPGDGSYDSFGSGAASATILDNDGGPTLVTFSTMFADTSEAGPDATLTLSRSGGNVALPLTVGYYSFGGSATPGVDYVVPTGEVTFAPDRVRPSSPSRPSRTRSASSTRPSTLP